MRIFRTIERAIGRKIQPAHEQIAEHLAGEGAKTLKQRT
jgi:hypothetical protein